MEASDCGSFAAAELIFHLGIVREMVTQNNN